MEEKWDVIVIGGGPGGYSAAIRASQLGMKTLLIEKGDLGGTCLNVGCIPTKYFVEFTNTLKNIMESKKFGIELSMGSVDYQVFQNQKQKIIDQLSMGVKNLLKKNKVEIVQGEATFVSDKIVQIQQENGELIIEGNHVIVAAGTRPAQFKIPFDGDKIVSSTDILSWVYMPKSIVIVGAGVIGMEFASILSQLGVHVSVIELNSMVLANEDQEIVGYLKKSLETKGVEFYLSTKVVDVVVNENDVVLTLENDSGTSNLVVEKVLVATGRVSNAELLRIENTDVETINGYIKVNGRMQTNIENLYAVGDITPGPQLAHVAYDEGIIAAENIAGNVKEMNYSAVPRTVFTSPEICAVGLTEDRAKELFDNVEAFKYPLQANGKALINGNGQTEGIVKIIIEKKYGEILGIAMVGPKINEMISTGTLAMTLEATVDEIANTIHPHPSLSEMMKEVSLLALGKPLHFG
ncbi:dihydrolipoyl dehydrogenase [Lysinibacillus sp. NPDC094177]|uniref:dihydrolipoyl dehydrogenase n=1 Tax=Lysinibacillus sp. NPDC094177 TaxID=3390580 RepID=UPI003D00F693